MSELQSAAEDLKEQRKQATLARREEMRKKAFENVGENPNELNAQCTP
jgi:hypothetical protein